MEPLESYDRAHAAASAVVTGIADDQFARPTPCTEWDVRAVLNHMVRGQLMVQAILAGRSHPDAKSDWVGRRPKRAFEQTVTETRAQLGAPGVLERTLVTPFGERPAGVLIAMMSTELFVHGWDLAKATGQSTDLDPELATVTLERVRAQLGERPRHLTMFGEARTVPDDATAADRLAAYLGRSVAVG